LPDRMKLRRRSAVSLPAASLQTKNASLAE